MKNLLLTGAPGVGKTTLVREVLGAGLEIAGGFYTEEIREAGVRMGFRIRTLDGASDVLAHVSSPSRHRVGRYGVNVEAFEGIGVKSIADALQRPGLVVMDEIGRMELVSAAFREMVLRALGSASRVFGVIQMRRNSFLDGIRRRPDTRVMPITSENRNQALPDILTALQ